MAEKERLKKIIEEPGTIGERDQSERLQKFHEDAEVIIDIRKKLDSLKSDLEEDQGDLEEKINILRKKKKEVSQHEKRYYDKSILKYKPGKTLKHLFSYFKIKRMFLEKYTEDKDRRVAWRLLNILTDKEIFYPDVSVYLFVKQLLVLQQQLMEYFRKMYRAGWLTKNGEDILSPYEFNIISEMERVLHDDTILNFLIYSKRPSIAINKINSFLGYYLSITRDSETISNLIKASEKSLKRIVFPDRDDRKEVPRVMKLIENFTSMKVYDEFIIPLFETALLEPFTFEKVSETVLLEGISDADYNASTNLQIMMANRKSEFTEKTKKKIQEIENELTFIESIIEKTGKKIKTDSRLLNVLDHYHFIYHKNDPEAYNLRRKNVAAFMYDLCEFFYKTYESFLIMGLHLKIGQSIESKPFFDSVIFKSEIDTLKAGSRDIARYVNSSYAFSILQKKDLPKNHALFIEILNKLNDAYYAIGEKLSRILQGHKRKMTAKTKFTTNPVSLKAYEDSLIPYFDETIAKKSHSISSQYSLVQKTVGEAIDEVITFCLCISFTFEYEHRDYRNAPRHESISEKIKKVHSLGDKLVLLQSGKDVDL